MNASFYRFYSLFNIRLIFHLPTAKHLTEVFGYWGLYICSCPAIVHECTLWFQGPTHTHQWWVFQISWTSVSSTFHKAEPNHKCSHKPWTLFAFWSLGIQPNASYMQGRRSTTELHLLRCQLLKRNLNSDVLRPSHMSEQVDREWLYHKNTAR